MCIRDRLYFNGQPVAGTAIRADGRFAMQVVLGDELPRSIEVRDRQTQKVLYQRACAQAAPAGGG